MKEIKNFREDQYENPRSNESYQKLEGIPNNSQLFGNTLTCSNSIILNVPTQTDLYQLFQGIDNVLSTKSKGSFPRFRKVTDNSLLTNLYDSLEKNISDNDNDNLILELENQTFILNDGRWYYFNDRYFEIINDNLDRILATHVSTNNKLDYDFSEFISDNQTESEFIESVSQNDSDNYIQLHLNTVKQGSGRYEIADLYSTQKDTLFIVKRNFSTNDSTHSFNQATLGLQLLQSNDLDYFKKNLNKSIDDKTLKNIKKCTNVSILWIVDKDEPSYIYEMIVDKKLDLRRIKSLFVRVAIVDWISEMKAQNYSPNIIFAIPPNNSNG